MRAGVENLPCKDYARRRKILKKSLLFTGKKHSKEKEPSEVKNMTIEIKTQ